MEYDLKASIAENIAQLLQTVEEQYYYGWGIDDIAELPWMVIRHQRALHSRKHAPKARISVNQQPRAEVDEEFIKTDDIIYVYKVQRSQS